MAPTTRNATGATVSGLSGARVCDGEKREEAEREPGTGLHPPPVYSVPVGEELLGHSSEGGEGCPALRTGEPERRVEELVSERQTPDDYADDQTAVRTQPERSREDGGRAIDSNTTGGG